MMKSMTTEEKNRTTSSLSPSLLPSSHRHECHPQERRRTEPRPLLKFPERRRRGKIVRLVVPLRNSSRRSSPLWWLLLHVLLFLMLQPQHHHSPAVQAFRPSKLTRFSQRIRNNVGVLFQPQSQSYGSMRKKTSTTAIRRSLWQVFRRRKQQPLCQPAAVSSSQIMMSSVLEPVETMSKNDTENLLSSSSLLDDEQRDGDERDVDDEEEIPYFAQQDHLERIHFAASTTPAQLTASALGLTATPVIVATTTNNHNNISITRHAGGQNNNTTNTNGANKEDEEDADVASSEFVLAPEPEQYAPKNGVTASLPSIIATEPLVVENNTADAPPTEASDNKNADTDSLTEASDTSNSDDNNSQRKWWKRGPLRWLGFFSSSGGGDAATTRKNDTTAAPTVHSIWRHRHARSAEEGIRREIIDSSARTTATTTEKTPPRRAANSSARQLRSVLAKANGSIERTSRHYAARTIAGLLHALAEEVDDLDVDVESRRDTPWHRKRVDAVRIQFSRLGFKPLRMGGHDSIAQRQQKAALRRDKDDNLALMYRNWKDYFAAAARHANRKGHAASSRSNGNAGGGVTLTADEAFDRIDVDQSGFLDRAELIQALTLAARTASSSNSDSDDSNSTGSAMVLLDEQSTNFESNQAILEDLAADLFELYDLNGDGVVDRKEYKNMVEDMAALRTAEARSRLATTSTDDAATTAAAAGGSDGWLEKAAGVWQNRTWPWSADHLSEDAKRGGSNETAAGPLAFFDRFKRDNLDDKASGSSGSIEDDDGDENLEESQKEQELVDVSSEVVGEVTKTFGSITFSDLKMDLRQILFGGIPVIKRITPGGPLILEPFKCTATGSFNREDIMNSVLLDMALKRLVMRVVRKRVGGVRDLLEGAVFKGRSWKTFGGEGGPKVEITELTNVEFDQNDKLIITGRARVRPRPDAAVIEQAFKVRTSIGTGMNGRSIRLEEPELALVVECPKAWEKGIGALCDALTIRKPPRPEPLYSFFPIYSPFKLNDDPGFYLGEDNVIESLYIEDGALRFEMSAVLRPGRFLGSHYIAFTVPQRTFIVTLDRVTEGIRSARKVKKAARALKHASDRSAEQRRNLSLESAAEDDELIPPQEQSRKAAASRKPRMKSFFSRFVDGYLQAERDDADKERLTTAIRDFFGRQQSS